MRSLAILLILINSLTVGLAQLSEDMQEFYSNPTPSEFATIKMEPHAKVSNTGTYAYTTTLGELSSGDVSVALTIKNSVGGIQAGEVPSEIGLGWNLSYGASLIRTVNGIPDEDQFGYLNDPARSNSALYFFSPIPLPPPAPDPNLICSDRYDVGPDLFQYTIGDYSGRFRFTSTGEIQHEPQQNVKIEYDNQLNEITIISPFGHRYRFGGAFGSNGQGARAVDFKSFDSSYPTSPQLESPVTRWHIRDIRDANGFEFMSFDYMPIWYEFESILNCTERTVSYDINLATGSNSGNYQEIVGCPSSSANIPGSFLDNATGSFARKVIVNGYLLSKVTSSTGEFISLEHSQNREDLGSIGFGNDIGRLKTVTKNNGYKTVKYDLFHSYAKKVSATKYYEKKLVLDSIVTKDHIGQSRGTYVFEYHLSKDANGEYVTASRLSPFKDHWGYLNSMSNSSVVSSGRKPRDRYVIHNYTNGYYVTIQGHQSDGLSKEANLLGSQHGSLKAVTLPSGLKYDIGTELHEALDYNPTNVDLQDLDFITGAYACDKYGVNDNCTFCSPQGEDGASSSVVSTLDPTKSYVLSLRVSRFTLSSSIPNHSQQEWNPASGNWACRECGITQFSDCEELYGKFTVSIPGVPFSIKNFTLNGNPDQVLRFNLDEIYPNWRSQASSIQLAANPQAIIETHGTLAIELFEAPQGQEYEKILGTRKVGGLRIKDLTTVDLIENNSFQTSYKYEYKVDNTTIVSGRLLNEPMYGFYSKKELPSSSYFDIFHLTSTAQNHLFSAAGTHIEYKNVHISNTGHQTGDTYLEYRSPRFSNVGQVIPLHIYNDYMSRYDPAQGSLLSTAVFNQNNDLVYEEENTYEVDSILFGVGKFYLVDVDLITLSELNSFCQQFPYACGFNVCTSIPPYTFWTAKVNNFTTKRLNLKKRVITYQGVKTTTDYIYSNMGMYNTFKSREIETSSSGTNLTYFYFCGNSSTSGIRNLALQNNQTDLILRKIYYYKSGSAPYKKVLDEYFIPRSFNISGSNVVYGPGVLRTAYPYFRKGTSSTWVRNYIFEEFTPWGEPKKFRRFQLPTRTYLTYDSKQRLQTIRKANFEKDFTYWSNSQLVKTSIDENGQLTNYSYDNLSRLSSISERGSNRTTSYSYEGFSDRLNPSHNSVKTTTTVTPTANNSTSTVAQKAFFNSKGNLIQSINIGGSNDNGDIITPMDYDVFGRVEFEYEPIIREVSSENFLPESLYGDIETTYGYENSPLGRIVSKSKAEYGSQTYDYDFTDGSQYNLPTGEYSTTTVTTAEGFETTTVSDALGRIVLKTDNAQNSSDIFYEYNEQALLANIHRLGVNSPTAHKTTFTYNDRLDLVTKLIPEEGLHKFLYDDQHRTIAEQSPFQAMKGFAVGHVYDDDYGYLKQSGLLSSFPSAPFSASAFIESVYEDVRSVSTKQIPEFLKPGDTYSIYDNGARLNTNYEYDSYGRVSTVLINDESGIAGVQGDVLSTQYEYDFFDQIAKKTEDFLFTNESIQHTYQYSNNNLLRSENVDLSLGSAKIFELDYNKRLQPERINLHVNGSDYWQSIDYQYTAHGDLSKINSIDYGSLPSTPCGLAKGVKNKAKSEANAMFNVSWDCKYLGSREDDCIECIVEATAIAPLAEVDLPSLFQSGPISYCPDREVEKLSSSVRLSFPYSLGSISDLKDSIMVLDQYMFSALHDSLPSPFSGFLQSVQDSVEKMHHLPMAREFYEEPKNERPEGRSLARSASSTVNKDLFAQDIERTSTHPFFGSSGGGVGRSDGLISYTRTQFGDKDPNDFAFTYDLQHKNALIKMNSSKFEEICTGFYGHTHIDQYETSYDYRTGPSSFGRFNELTRYAPGVGTAKLRSDRIDYRYYSSQKPNRITSSYEWTSHRTRLYDGGFSNFGYDAVGNITTLPSSTYARRVSLIYGRNQKPTTYKLGSTQSLAYSLFDQTEMGYTNFNSGDVFMRYGSLELKNGVPFRYHHDHGYYDFVMKKWIYRISDYLGTPRVYFTDLNNDGNITLADDALSYKTLYPFGMVASEYNRPSTSTERRDFTGHDLMIEGFQGLHDMNARQYVGGLGVFLSVDPLADQFPSYTPYHYVHNNPINLIDPTGMSADTLRVHVYDQEARPQDNGTSGTTYTADIFVYDDETGDLKGPYEGSSYPNSKSNSDNGTNANTVNEGTHNFNNASGHRGGTKDGLNLVDSNGNRTSPGTDPNGNSVTMTYVNVHAGQSDKGNYNSRGSQGCVTICPKDATSFFSNFPTPSGTHTGTASGTINIQRGNKSSNISALKKTANTRQLRNWNNQKFGF